MNAYERKAKIIREQFGDRIARATAGTTVPQRLLAGLIGNECAFDSKRQRFAESVPRFEPHVYAALVSLRDRGYYVTRQGARKARYGRVLQADLANAPDAAVRALASSWGPGQIMGYNAIDFGCTVADLRDPDKSLGYIVRMLIRDAAPYIARSQWEAVFRIWNTGSPTGKTYSPTYVPQGLAVMAAYAALGAAAPGTWAAAVPAPDAEHKADEERGRGHDEDVAVTDPLAAETPAAVASAPVPQMTEPQQPAPTIVERLKTSTTFVQSLGVSFSAVVAAVVAFFQWPGAPWVMLGCLVLAVAGYVVYQWAEKNRKKAEADAQAAVRKAELDAAARIEEARKHEPSAEQVAALRAQWEAERGITDRRRGARKRQIQGD